MSKKKPALGKGLSALLENAETDITSKSIGKEEPETEKVVGSVNSISLENIEANPFQPRTKFEEEALNELASSIEELGIIQPITVRKMGYGKYQLISGERRLKASEIAGLKEIPAFIRIANDQSMLEMALVENIQRENLNAIEIGISYKRLIEECKLTQEALSERVGKKRSTIANYLRLLKLPAEVQMGLRKKWISMGHARALVNVSDPDMQLKIFAKVLEEELSVRETEELVRGNTIQTSKGKRSGSSSKKAGSNLSFSQQKLKEDLSNQLETNIKLQVNNKGKGKLVIPFKSEKQLEKIAEILGI